MLLRRVRLGCAAAGGGPLAPSLASPLAAAAASLARAASGGASGDEPAKKTAPTRLPPRPLTYAGAAAERGEAPRRWPDEPVPPQSVSASAPFHGLPAAAARGVAARALPAPRVQVSTLANGLRVATQDCYGQVSTFALFVDAGSAYEDAAAGEQGVCHFLETAAFKSSRGRSAQAVLDSQLRQGLGTFASFNREVVMLKADVLRERAPAACEHLADAALHADWADEELEAARGVIRFQRDEALSQPQLLVSENLYAAAYGAASPLGRPEKCAEGQAERVTRATLRGYAAKYFTAPRMVLAAVNVDHDVAVRAAEAHFGHVPREGAPGALRGRAVSPYVGGDARSSPDWAAVPATAAGAQAASKTEFTHVMLALPTVGWSHDDVVPVCVVDTLLGGGSSFSAGGPGKGMYSRLYREVLNMHSWVESANAFSTQLYDCGIVGVYGAAPPEHAGELTGMLANHLLRLCSQRVTPEELKRSANQLASSVLMNLETRGLLVEDVGRQILSHGKRLDPSALVARIRAVTPEDIIRVMRTALAAPPSFAAVGDVSRIADYEAIREHLERSTQRWRFAAGSTFAKGEGGGAGAGAAAAAPATARPGRAKQQQQQQQQQQAAASATAADAAR